MSQIMLVFEKEPVNYQVFLAEFKEIFLQVKKETSFLKTTVLFTFIPVF